MRVTSKGQVTIPKSIRDRLGIAPGSEVDFIVDRSRVELVAAKASPRRTARRDAVEVWLREASGTLDLGGMSADEYVDWLRGPRDDLQPVEQTALNHDDRDAR